MTVKVHAAKVEMIALGDLSNYGLNARTHPDSQIDALARIITDSGFTNPLLIDEKNVIVAGHGRLLAAAKLGMTQVPCVRLSGLSKAQIKALRLSDNAAGLQSGWDEAMLKAEVRDLLDEDFDMALLGFDELEIDKLLAVELLDVGSGEDGEGRSGVKQRILNIDGQKVPMTDDEAEQITAALTAYGKANGMLYGFVSHLLTGAA